jgi:methyltransferase (TIGR00027 family)
MQQRSASVTAIVAAGARAIHQLIDDDPKILPDPVVVSLFEAMAPGSVERFMQKTVAPGTIEWRLQSYSPAERPISRAGMMLRSRFAEDELAIAASQGVGQYVILGAGLDTFAYRQPPYASPLEIFEVDHPASQEWKRQGLGVAGIALPPNLHWVPVDFERQTLAEQLEAAGFDSTRSAFFCWLGVTQYLTRPAIDETLRFVAGLPSPSTLVLTLILPEEALPEDQRSRRRLVAQHCAELGEPWLTFFRPDELCAHLHDLGFERVFHLTPEDAKSRYFGSRRDGVQVSPYAHEHLVSAII